MFKEGDAKGKGSRETAESPPVIDFAYIQSLDNKICVLDGTNLRQLIDGLGLCWPGITVPAQMIHTPFWKVVRRSLLDICDRTILKSAVIRHNLLLSVLTETF